VTGGSGQVGLGRPSARHRYAGSLRAAACTATVVPLLRWMVILHSVHSGQPWRHSCPRCGTRVGPGGDLRAVSPLARCGTCRQRLGAPPWTVELAAAVSAAALVWSGLRGLPLAGYLWWAALGLVLAFVDAAVQRLPARLSYTATGGLLVLLAAEAWRTHDWHPWLRSALGALVAAFAVAVCALVAPRLVHWGDVRYALAVGAAAAWAGWPTLYTAAFLATLSAALTGIGLILGRKASLATQLAQGPHWYGGALLALVLLQQVASRGS
jgi:leader peptidase (prepilin peptidase) / N-methyltransferase